MVSKAGTVVMITNTVVGMPTCDASYSCALVIVAGGGRTRSAGLSGHTREMTCTEMITTSVPGLKAVVTAMTIVPVSVVEQSLHTALYGLYRILWSGLWGQ